MKKVFLKIIDMSVYILIRLSKNSYLYFTPQNKARPLFIMAMYRSGTSLTSQILRTIGVNFGKDYRLLQSQGKLKNLNPDGFFEDFLFAQLSRFLFDKLKADGASPPSKEQINNFTVDEINLAEFIKYSYFIVKEDRISKYHQLRALTNLRIFKEKYLLPRTSKIYAIKIPMLVPFYEFLNYVFPQAKFLIIIRNPDSTIKSAKILTEKSNIELYNKYYVHLYNLINKYPDKSSVFSYDNLLLQPEFSIKKLADKFDVKNYSDTYSLIKKKYIRNQVEYKTDSKFYETLKLQAINKL